MNIDIDRIKKTSKKFERDTLSDGEIKIGKQKAFSLENQKENFLLILELVQESIKKRYKVDAKDLAILIGMIVYVISPIDVIPDFIPIFGYIDDIALVALGMKQLSNIISTYKEVTLRINVAIDQTIENEIVAWCESVKKTIKKQYKSLVKHIICEGLFFFILIAMTHFYPNIPAIPLAYGFIGINIVYAITKVLLSFNRLLKSIDFFKVSRFWMFFKETKNIKKSFKLDAENFYDFHYDKLSGFQRKVHKIGAAIKVVPSKDGVFEKIYNSVMKNIKIFLIKEAAYFGIVFILYALAIQIIRYVVFNSI